MYMGERLQGESIQIQLSRKNKSVAHYCSFAHYDKNAQNANNSIALLLAYLTVGSRCIET